MPQFKLGGKGQYDFWLVNGDPDFSVIQALEAGPNQVEAPVRLQIGNPAMGADHIKQKHSHWIFRHLPTVPEFLYFKLGQTGWIFNSQDPSRIEIALHDFPHVLLVLGFTQHRKLGDFYTVITMYHHNRAPKGKMIGHYLGLPSI